MKRYESEISEDTLLATFQKCFLANGLPKPTKDEDETTVVAAILALLYTQNDIFGVFP